MAYPKKDVRSISTKNSRKRAVGVVWGNKLVSNRFRFQIAVSNYFCNLMSKEKYVEDEWSHGK